MGELTYYERKDLRYKFLIYYEKFVNSAVCCTPGDNFVIEYLDEIELACLSRAKMGANREKREGRKFRDTLSFN